MAFKQKLQIEDELNVSKNNQIMPYLLNWTFLQEFFKTQLQASEDHQVEISKLKFKSEIKFI